MNNIELIRPNPILCRLGYHKWSKESLEIRLIGTVKRCERLCGQRRITLNRALSLTDSERENFNFRSDDPWHTREVEDLEIRGYIRRVRGIDG